MSATSHLTFRLCHDRSARSIAVGHFEGFEGAKDSIYQEIEENDVAHLQAGDIFEEEITEESAADNDETAEEAEDWVFHESADENYG